MAVLRPIYTVQLCRMRYAFDKSTTRIVSCKSNLQHACDCRLRYEKCRGLLKHVLKPYDNRSDRQFDTVEIVYDFSMTRAARPTKITCDIRKQKSHRVNRPFANIGERVGQASHPLLRNNRLYSASLVAFVRQGSLSHTLMLMSQREE